MGAAFLQNSAEYNIFMEIRLRPEIAELIKQDVQRGPYQSVDEFVEHAVSMLHEQEAWLAGNRSEIEAKIHAGYAAAGRGELIDAEEVRSKLDAFKRSLTPQQE
jgi:Arc/MetJ-type ribon-helix-helix transcriptional regulator